jgi:hypothetical protein
MILSMMRESNMNAKDKVMKIAENNARSMADILYMPNTQKHIDYANSTWDKVLKAIEYCNQHHDAIYACIQGAMNDNGDVNFGMAIYHDWCKKFPHISREIENILEDNDSGFSMAYKLNQVIMAVGSINYPNENWVKQWLGED